MNSNIMVLRRSFLLPLLLFISLNAGATTVTYSTANISGNTWEYSYTVSNDTLSVAIEEFTIYFDYTLYSNLSLPIAPVDWDPLGSQPDTNIPNDGYFDALSLTTSVAINPGSTLGGFSVRFDYLGAGRPGSQLYEIVDPTTIGTIDTGATQVVPLLPAVWLFGSGLLGLVGISRNKAG